LVKEILDLSKLDAGATPLNLVTVEAESLLSDALSEARLGHPDIQFILKESTTAPLRIVADPARLQQVFANLLDNAARHSPAGGMVTVCANRGSNVTVFDVTDRGTGIPPLQRDRVFERFTRGHPAGRDGGTGLGLAIARWVIELHHGTIAIVDPPDGIGCRVRITLPDQPALGGKHDQYGTGDGALDRRRHQSGT
jgi:signal transduction histidine kinase